MGDSPERRRKGKEPMEEEQSSAARNTRARTSASIYHYAGGGDEGEGSGPAPAPEGPGHAAARRATEDDTGVQLRPEHIAVARDLGRAAAAAGILGPAPGGHQHQPPLEAAPRPRRDALYRDAQGSLMKIGEFGMQFQWPSMDLPIVQMACSMCGRICYNGICVRCVHREFNPYGPVQMGGDVPPPPQRFHPGPGLGEGFAASSHLVPSSSYALPGGQPQAPSGSAGQPRAASGSAAAPRVPVPVHLRCQVCNWHAGTTVHQPFTHVCACDFCSPHSGGMCPRCAPPPDLQHHPAPPLQQAPAPPQHHPGLPAPSLQPPAALYFGGPVHEIAPPPHRPPPPAQHHVTAPPPGLPQHRPPPPAQQHATAPPPRLPQPPPQQQPPPLDYGLCLLCNEVPARPRQDASGQWHGCSCDVCWLSVDRACPVCGGHAAWGY